MQQWASAVARRRPELAFGLAGGAFALLFVLTDAARGLLAGEPVTPPSGTLWLLVLGGFAGGALLAALLWRRLGGARSRGRGVVVGALVGLLALPVPFYILEVGVLLVSGNPFGPHPGGLTPLVVLSDAAAFLVVPLFLGALGLIPTYGGTVVVGAAVGLLLAWRTPVTNEEA
ncbi:hypothetical protein [Halocalculus aciditolerans]|uniref:Uncharacterized protein n=1 Tax=Halocalculus aciditolerans TaxID=1383812 RepID=A0A830F9X7_9EURY|nr:hypothetical protein [Halocalculus aciditolerans]GGL54444.1 hypothetical protein GCM10009039_10740 [Halocalculus aciditolerans]